MGLLTQMIGQKHQKEMQEKQIQADAWAQVLSDPNAEPDAREYAFSQLSTMAGLGKGDGKGGGKGGADNTGILRQMLGLGGGGLVGMAVNALRKRPNANAPAGTAPASGPPVAENEELAATGVGVPAEALTGGPGQMVQNARGPQISGSGPVSGMAGMPGAPSAPPRMFMSPEKIEAIRLAKKESDLRLANDAAMKQDAIIRQRELEAQTAKIDNTIHNMDLLEGAGYDRAAAAAIAGVPGSAIHYGMGGNEPAPKKLLRIEYVERGGKKIQQRWFNDGSMEESEDIGKQPTGAATDPNKLVPEVKTLMQGYMAGGMNEQVARTRALADYNRKWNTNVSKSALDLAINQELSGIGTGGTGGAPSAPAAAPALGAPAPAPGTPAPAPGAGALPFRQTDNVSVFIGNALGFLPVGRGGAAILPMRRGMRELMEKTGLSETQLYAAITEKKGTAKALIMARELDAGLDRLQKTLQAHGNLAIEAASKLDDTGVPVFNRWLRGGMRKIAGDPDVSRLDNAVAAVQGEYAKLRAQGFASRAMPPVSKMEDAKEIFANWFTTGQIAAVVDQMRLEAVAEQKAYRENMNGLYRDLANPFGAGGPDTDPARREAGELNRQLSPTTGTAGKPKTAQEFLQLIKPKK